MIATESWKQLDAENKYAVHRITHFNIVQRWIVVHSHSAKLRSEKMLNKQIEKEYQAVKLALMHLRNQMFACEINAKKALEKVESRFKYHQVMLENVESKACDKNDWVNRITGKNYLIFLFVSEKNLSNLRNGVINVGYAEKIST